MSCWSHLDVCLAEAVWMYVLLKPFGCMSCWSRIDLYCSPIAGISFGEDRIDLYWIHVRSLRFGTLSRSRLYYVPNAVM
jgi:hypothetical protein